MTRSWTQLGDFGDALLEEFETYAEYKAAGVDHVVAYRWGAEAWEYFSWTLVMREEFWEQYGELALSPLGVEWQERDDLVADLFEVTTLQPVDGSDSDDVTRWSTYLHKTTSLVDPAAKVGVGGQALDAEWVQRNRTLSAGSSGSIALKDDLDDPGTMWLLAYDGTSQLQPSIAAELNGMVADMTRLEQKARRLTEYLVVVDRRAVTVVPPPLLVSDEWDFWNARYRLKVNRAEPQRFWEVEKNTELALLYTEAKARKLVLKLKREGVIVRTWRPDNTTPGAKKVRAAKYWHRARLAERPAAGSPEVFSFKRWSPGRLLEVLEELDPD